MGTLQTLKPGLDGFRDAFNERADLPRLLTLTSPTCEACLRGAAMVRSELLEAMDIGPDRLRYLVVWINMLEADGWEAATEAAQIFAPFAHVAQFHDPHQRIGQELASSIQYPEQIAWDFYVLYPPGERWLEGPPRPQDWVHQLGQQDWPDPDKYAWNEDLAPALRRLVAPQLESSSGAT